MMAILSLFCARD